MARELRSRLRCAAGDLHSVLHLARNVWPAPVLAIAAAALLAAAQAQPAPSPAKGTWTKLAPMLHPQNEAATVVIGNRVYVMGGFTLGTDGPIDRVQVYDTAKNEWSEGTPLPDPVHHHGTALVGGKIYLVGGFHEPFPKRDPIDSTWVFDPFWFNRRLNLCAASAEPTTATCGWCRSHWTANSSTRPCAVNAYTV